MSSRQLIRDPSFAESFRIQTRVISALLLRELATRYGRHNIGFLWLFVEPMLFTLGITALWTMGRAIHGSSIPIAVFALTGYSAVLLWRNMPARCIGAIGPNLALMFHRNVRAMDIFLARIILEGVGATISFIVLSLFFIGIEWIAPPEDFLKVVAGWFMLAWFGMALALLLGAFSERSEIVDKLWHPMAYLLFPLSGAAFLVDAVPQGMQEVILWLPMIHAVELIRDGYFGSAFTAHYNMVYMAAWNMALTLFGLAELRSLNQRLTPE